MGHKKLASLRAETLEKIYNPEEATQKVNLRKAMAEIFGFEK